MADDQLLSTHGKSDIIKLFWLGFIMYTLGYFLSINGSSFLISAGIQGLGLILLLPTTISLIQFRAESSYFIFLFIIYCIWLFTVLIRGFQVKLSFIQMILFNAFEGALFLFVPLISVFSKSVFFFKKMFSTISLFGVIFIFYCFFFLKTLINPDISSISSQGAIEYSAKILSIPCGFILLTYKYHSKKRNWLACIVLVVTLLFSIIRARRGLVFMAGFPLIIAMASYFLANQKGGSNFIMKLLIIITLFSAIFLYLYSVKGGDYGIFSSFLLRVNEDTRSGVVLYFLQDMNLKDWIIGKGIDGQYFFPSEEGFYRKGIETDYLNIILKGGIISLVLMLLILIPAVFKGIFYSKNMLSKAAGIWILFYLLCLYPSPVTKFSMFYIIVWVAVGICYSKRIRELSDDTIVEYFRS